MNILNTGGMTAEQAEAQFNLANNGVLTRIDERGRPCEDLYQWGCTRSLPRHMEVSPMTSNRGLWVRWLCVDADQRVDPVCSSSFLDGCSGGRGRPIEAFPIDVSREGNFEQAVLSHSAENIERKTIVHFVAGSDPT